MVFPGAAIMADYRRSVANAQTVITHCDPRIKLGRSPWKIPTISSEASSSSFAAQNIKDHTLENPIAAIPISCRMPIKKRPNSNQITHCQPNIQLLKSRWPIPTIPHDAASSSLTAKNIEDRGLRTPITAIPIPCRMPIEKRPPSKEQESPRKRFRFEYEDGHDDPMTALSLWPQEANPAPTGIKIFGVTITPDSNNCPIDFQKKSSIPRCRVSSPKMERKKPPKRMAMTRNQLHKLPLLAMPPPSVNQCLNQGPLVAITKALTASDVSKNLHRLLLTNESAELLLSQWSDPGTALRIRESGKGEKKKEYLRVVMQDRDTETSYDDLVFTRWGSGLFSIIGGWFDHFVIRRQLKEGDVIELSWDCASCCFLFRVLSRAPTSAAAGDLY